MRCPRCGAELCPLCGIELPGGAEFCPYCGQLPRPRPLEVSGHGDKSGVPTRPREPPVREPTAVRPPAEEPMVEIVEPEVVKACSVCDRDFSVGMVELECYDCGILFCPECESKFRSVPKKQFEPHLCSKCLERRVKKRDAIDAPPRPGKGRSAPKGRKAKALAKRLLKEAQAKHDEGNPRDTLSLAQQSYDLEPSVLALILIGHSNRTFNNPKEAGNAYREALKLDPGSNMAKRSLEDLERTTLARTEARRLMAEGIKSAKGGDLSRSLELMDASLDVMPTPEGYTNKGHILRKLHRLQEAESSYANAIDLDPDHINASKSLRAVRRAREDQKRAKMLLKAAIREAKEGNIGKAISLADDSLKIRETVEGHTNIAHFFRKGGELELARASYMNALKIKTGHESAMKGLKVVEKKLRMVNERAQTVNRPRPRPQRATSPSETEVEPPELTTDQKKDDQHKNESFPPTDIDSLLAELDIEDEDLL